MRFRKLNLSDDCSGKFRFTVELDDIHAKILMKATGTRSLSRAIKKVVEWLVSPEAAALAAEVRRSPRSFVGGPNGFGIKVSV